MQLDYIGLYDQYFDDVYRYVLFKTGNQWDTDDLVSEIFRKTFEKYDTLKGAPKPWLFTIARNTVIDFYRRRKDIALGDDLDLLTYPGYFEDDLERKDEINCLKQALKTLDKHELELVNLRYFSQLTYRQVGKTIGKTENSVKMKIFRITKKLGAIVKGCLEG